MAVIAAGVVIGVGATVTLATWNDSEWVTGGASSDSPFVGTSNFSIQQNVAGLPYADGAWADRPNQPGGLLNFTVASLSLSPGTAVYAPVSLSTRAADAVAGTPGSVRADSLVLNAAIPATQTIASTATPAPSITGAVPASDSGLWNNVLVRVVVTQSAKGASPEACNAALFATGASFVVGNANEGVSINTAGTVTTTLAANGTDKQNYCFEIALPSSANTVIPSLQGMKISPAWQFVAGSA